MSQNTCADCKTTFQSVGFPYEYCDPSTGKFKWVCSVDPNQPLAPYQNYTPFRLCYPFKTFYNDTPIMNGLKWGVWYYTTKNADGSPKDDIVVFNEGTVQTIFEEQLLTWSHLICEPLKTSNCYDCTIKLKWAGDDAYSLFPDKINYPAYTPILSDPQTGSGCNLDCSNFAILLNTSSHWTGVKDWENPTTPERFFVTRPLEPGHPAIYDNWYNLRTIILHELGHALGFDHTSSDCGASQGIMSDKTANQMKPPELSDYDKCMFRLLYCCAPATDVETIDQSKLYVDILPNPVNNELVIKYNILNSSQVNFYLFNSNGQLVNNDDNKKFTEQGTHTAYIGIGNLSDGMYNLILQIGNQVISKKVLIVK
jgi:hypothetical protein